MTTDTRLTTEPPRLGLGAWQALAIAEAKMVIRDTAGLIIPIGLPLLILTMHGVGDAGQSDDGVAMSEFVIPIVISMVMATIGVINMPSFLSAYRRYGVLRRLAVTPASPAMILVTQVVVSAVQTIIGIGLALTVAVLAFDARLPEKPLTAAAVILLAAMAMYAVGMLIAATAPTPNAALALGLLAFFAMAAVGGMFGPRENLPDVMATVGEVLPFGASMELIGAAWVGAPLQLGHIVSLGVAFLLSAGVAARFFRWE